ncbi:hypothetical protein ACH3XW_27865 [Acanthocheilonema viteae]
MEIGNASKSSSHTVMVDAQMAIPITEEGNVITEAAFFNRIFPSNSGIRFNFDDIREFLHDPLIALIATDLTADENLDNIEAVLKRIGKGHHHPYRKLRQMCIRYYFQMNPSNNTKLFQKKFHRNI